MVQFIMFCGVPAAGKSMIAEKYFNGYTIVSSDGIREEIFGDATDQTHNAEVFEIARKRVIAALKEGKNCVLDSTNINSKRRISFLKNLRHISCEKICYIVAPRPEICYERNKSRERQVPEYVIKRMFENFQVPSKAEGFDEILVERTPNVYELNEMFHDAEEMPHDNPHHSLSVGAHMEEAYNYAVKNHFPMDVCHAAHWHDIGKIYTKVFHNMRGQHTKCAHYYNHDNFGAYLVLSTFEYLPIEDILYISLLINHHMAFFKGEKYIEKIRRLYGEDFYQDLLKLHEADLAAH